MPESAERATSPNLAQLLEDTLHHGKDLLQAELSLARGELSQEVSATCGSLGVLALGAMFLQSALTTLGVILVLKFGVGAVAIALLVLFTGVGSLLLVRGLRGLEGKKLPRTTARLALDVERVMETVK